MLALFWVPPMANSCRNFPSILSRGRIPREFQQSSACRLLSVSIDHCYLAGCSRRSNITLDSSQTSSRSFNEPQNRPVTVSREIKTFDPSQMIEKGQEVFDISGYRFPRFHFSSPISSEKKILFQVQFDSSRVASALRRPFPAGSTGSLYYYQPPPPFPDIAGTLRFRIMPHVEAFADGKDILRPNGSPWQIHLCRLAKSDCWAPVRSKLLEESLVDPTVLADLKRLKMNTRGKPRYHYYLGQPFELDMSSGFIFGTLISRSVAARIRWDIVYGVYVRVRKSYSPPPYTGVLL